MGFQSPSKLLWSNSWIAQTVKDMPGHARTCLGLKDMPGSLRSKPSHLGADRQPAAVPMWRTTMSHIVDVCRWTKFLGGLRALHCVDDDAGEWFDGRCIR